MTAISRGQLSLGHRSCLRHCLRHTHEMRERTNCRRGCSFSFFSFMEYYTGKGRNGQDKKKKTCRETQHVKIDMERDASIIICRMVAVGENYNSTRDNEEDYQKIRKYATDQKLTIAQLLEQSLTAYMGNTVKIHENS